MTLVFVALALLVWKWPGTRERADRSEPARAPAPTAVGETHAPAADEGRVESAPMSGDVKTCDFLVVADDDDTPLAGVMIELYSLAPDLPFDSPVPLPVRGETDREGRLELRAPESAAQFVARKRGFLVARDFLQGGTTTVFMRRGITVAGRVLFAGSDAPVEGRGPRLGRRRGDRDRRQEPHRCQRPIRGPGRTSEPAL